MIRHHLCRAAGNPRTEAALRIDFRHVTLAEVPRVVHQSCGIRVFYFQAKLVTELAFNETGAAILASRNSAVLAGPEFVTIRTFWPSGFSRATCRRPAASLCDS